jgi:hypothetical protein
MIIEIAIGIVLAVIILNYLDRILAFGVIALVIGLTALVIIWVAASVYDNYGEEIVKLSELIFTALGLIGVIYLIGALIVSPLKNAYKDIKLIGFSPYLNNIRLSFIVYLNKNKPSVIAIGLILIFCIVIMLNKTL